MKHEPKLIAIFMSSLKGGGAERVMLNLAEGFTECGYQVDLIVARPVGQLLADLPDSVRLVDLRQPRISLCLLGLAKYLRRVQPDALISSMMDANIVAIWARMAARVSTPLMITEHNSIVGRPPENWRGNLMPYLAKFFYPLADHIVAVSKALGSQLCEIFPSANKRIIVIYNPIITPEVRQKSEAAVDHPWFNGNQIPVLLSVGRLTAQKDFDTLVRAFAKVRRDRNVRLCILGEGEERSSLEALIASLGLEHDVMLCGFQVNPYTYMSHAPVFVLSSIQEGLANVLIEALYCGASVVSTDCPVGPREVLADGKYGTLVPVGDVDALADAIQKALDDDQYSAAPEESWHPFESSSVVAQYLEVLFGGQ